MIFYQSERRYPPPPSVFFCTPPLFNSSLCSWFEIVSFVRKCKNLASMVIICKRYKMLYVGTILLRDVMGDFQYKMWFSIRMRGGMTPILLKCVIICNVHLPCFMMALFFLKNLMADFQYKMWFSIRVRGCTPDPRYFSVHLPFIFYFQFFLELN